jgi:hypothetical protein
MILGHIFGLPVEETAIQLAPAGAATMTVIAIAGRTKLNEPLPSVSMTDQ